MISKTRDSKRMERTAFLVKTSTATAEQLKVFAKENRTHRVALVEKVLDAIAMHPERLAELHSEDATPAEALERLMVDLEAANRSILAGRYLSAEEDLERILKSKHHGERFSNWAHNRLAYCWLGLAHERRREALRVALDACLGGGTGVEPVEALEPCMGIYTVAIKCLHRSIGFGNRVSGPLMWVARFNVVCSNVSISSYLCEQAALSTWLRTAKRPYAALGPKHDKVTQWMEAGCPTDFASDVYNELPPHQQASIKSTALEGLRSLEQIVRDLRKAHSSAEHVSWILRACSDPRAPRMPNGDLDLDFLRLTDEFKPRFQRIIASLEDQKRSVTRWFEEKLAVD